MRRLIKDFALRKLGRHAPTFLRFLAYRTPFENGRYRSLCLLLEDPRCRDWLASLENPTQTRHGFGIFTVPGDLTSDWIKLYGQHEVSTERFILDHQKADATFLDLGANIGYFSLLAAATGRMRVVAFEPQQSIAQLLVRSVEHNHFQDRIRVEQLALSDVAATMKMTSCPGNTGHAQLIGAEETDPLAETVSVVVLDEWLEPHPVPPVAVCKIDTEGAEFQVLSGMKRLLDRDGPALVVELIEEHLARFGASSARVLELLKAHGYRDVSPSYATRYDCNRYFVKAS